MRQLIPDEKASVSNLETKFALKITLWESNAIQVIYYYHRNR